MIMKMYENLFGFLQEYKQADEKDRNVAKNFLEMFLDYTAFPTPVIEELKTTKIKTKLGDKKCVNCWKEFRWTNAQKYCSWVCNRENKSKRPPLKKVIWKWNLTKVCANCDSTFKTYFKDQVCCSQKCSSAMRKWHNKERKPTKTEEKNIFDFPPFNKI